MHRPPLPTATRLRLMVSLTSSGICALGGVVLIAYLLPVIRFTPAQLLFILALVMIYMPPIIVVTYVMQKRWLRGTLTYLDQLHAGEDPPQAIVQAAFADTVDLPRRLFVFNFVSFFFGAVFIASAIVWRYAAFDSSTGLIMFASALSAGTVTQIFIFILLKMVLEAVRNDLAIRIVDPALRQRYVRSVSMPRQLFVTLVGVTFATAIYAILLTQGRALRFLEANTVGAQSAILERITSNVSAGQQLREALREAHGAYAPLGIEFLSLDPSGGVLEGRSDLLTEEELHTFQSLDPTAGDSIGFDSPNSFSWRRVRGDGPILLAVTPADVLQTDLSGATGLIFLATGGVVFVAIGLAFFASRDLSRSMGLMRDQLRRIAAGDLRRVELLEAENELGELSRAMDAMRSSLAETIGWILNAAEGVERAAAEIGTATRDIADGSRAQVDGIGNVTRSIDLVGAQMGGIASSTSTLSESVDESSGAVTQLKAGSVNLHGNSSVLSERARETSSAVEEIARSLDHVVHSNEQLARAVEEASGSLAEIVAQVGALESTAAEATRLADQVVSTAEQGSGRVRETIQGMDQIREATETAERVMTDLVERTSDIGSIVNVIDDVADETNLLALNAAIIAAQAGEHGRAFSVVADEVRELADRVTQSTKEISAVIRDLQQESRNAAGVVRSGSDNVRRGVGLSAEAGVSLEQITGAAQQSGRLIGEIVHALGEHGRASRYVVELMERVSESVHEIRAAGLEQKKSGELVLREAIAVDEIATQVRTTAAEQAQSTERINESIESVQRTVVGIHQALEQQRLACAQVMQLLREIQTQTDRNENAARTTDDAVRGLLVRFQELRADVERRFRF